MEAVAREGASSSRPLVPATFLGQKKRYRNAIELRVCCQADTKATTRARSHCCSETMLRTNPGTKVNTAV